MLANIIPTQKLPRSLSILSYKIPPKLEDKIKIGQLVTIPLRQKITTGVIFSLPKQPKSPNYPLKDILSLVNKKSIFTSKQLELFIQLAEYYSISASLLTHFNLPKLIKKDWQKIPEPTFKSSQTTKISTPSFFWWSTKNERNKFYLEQIQNSKTNQYQILIVVPRINDISRLAKELKLKKTDYISIHRQLSRAEKFKTWTEVMSSKSLVIIGTRSSLFYPFIQLKTIIIHDEQSLDHKQYDMNPRYEVKIVAEKINSVYQAKTIFSSASPSLIAYHQFNLQAPKRPETKIMLVDLNNELAQKNYSFISHQLFVQIQQTLGSKKSIFLFINKKGESSSTSCRDCGFIFRCPICQLPLIKTKQNHLICYYCQHQEDFPPFCPKCSGPNFHYSGLGIQKIETNLKKILPQVNIILLDKESEQKLSSASFKLPAVYLGTQFALDKINWTKIGLAGIINADNLWQHAEFMSSETTYQLLIRLLTLSPKNVKLIIQTFSPEHYIIKSINQNQPKIFYSQELKFRKTFDYPPFTNLIKLSYLNKSELKAKKESQTIYNKLHYKLHNSKKFSLIPSFPILRKKIRGKFKYNIILKLDNLNNFKALVKLIPHDWLIDIQPRRLLD